MNEAKRKLLERYRNMTPAELESEMKKVYPKAAKEVHPDLHPEDREEATRRMAELNRRRDEAIRR